MLAQLPQKQLIKLLHSNCAITKTSAAYNLSPIGPSVANELLKQLSVEKCLYTKIAICKSLEQGNIDTAEQMIKYLGIIGNNQHKKLPDRVSAKKSFPLPRDIIARSLSKMDVSIFPLLLEVLNSGSETQIREVLDAVGFMAFYNCKLANKKTAKEIYKIIEKHKGNDLIIWKSILCLSAFPLPKSVELLTAFSHQTNIFGKEANRSLKLIINISSTAICEN